MKRQWSEAALALAAAVVLFALLVLGHQLLTSSGRHLAAGPSVLPPPALEPGTTTSTSAPRAVPKTSQTVAPAPAAPPATQIPATSPALTAAGSVLVAPPAADIRTEDAPNDCASLADAGWQGVSCQSQAVDGVTFTYLLEFQAEGSTSIASRAYLFRQLPDGRQQVKLEAGDTRGTAFVAGEIDASFADIEPQGKMDAVFTFDRQQPAGSVSMDLVQLPDATVKAHQDLADASIVTSPGELDTYAADAGPYGSFTHYTIQLVAGAWRARRQAVSYGDVPRTMFS